MHGKTLAKAAPPVLHPAVTNPKFRCRCSFDYEQSANSNQAVYPICG
jgi:hypothetical protein